MIEERVTSLYRIQNKPVLTLGDKNPEHKGETE
jgi:hypothetical protein